MKMCNPSVSYNRQKRSARSDVEQIFYEIWDRVGLGWERAVSTSDTTAARSSGSVGSCA